MADAFLQRYTGRITTAADDSDVGADDVEDLGGWGLLRGVRDRSVSLELRKRDGTILAIPYVLIEQFLFNPRDEIVLRVNGREVRISGHGLNQLSEQRPVTLFSALTRHRAQWVAEKSRADAGGTHEIPRVETIEW